MILVVLAIREVLTVEEDALEDADVDSVSSNLVDVGKV